MNLDVIEGLSTVTSGNSVLGIIISNNFAIKSNCFLSPEDSPQQVAVMSFLENDQILPHIHNSVPRNVSVTQEVIIVVEGEIRVDFYDDKKNYIVSKIISDGDILVLTSGGHAFTFIKATRMVEVKNGPYVGESDRTRFPPVHPSKILIRN